MNSNNKEITWPYSIAEYRTAVIKQLQLPLQERAKIAKRFIGEIIDFMDKLPKKKFNFEMFVSGWDNKHECGSVCCIQGWLPKIYPGYFAWVDNNYLTKVIPNENTPIHAIKVISPLTSNYHFFEPHHMGISIKQSAWVRLTMPHSLPEYEVQEDNKWEGLIRDYWVKVYKDISKHPEIYLYSDKGISELIIRLSRFN